MMRDVGDSIQSPHRLYLASAGSGKTFQLTNKYLGLLLAGEEPGSLLATTFTRAAAGEILHRTLARLSDAALDDQSLNELRAHIDPEPTRDQCERTLSRVVESLHRLSVMTIDAFFARLASSFSFELGLSPGWRIIEVEEDELLRAAAVDQTLRESSTSEIIELLRDLQGANVRHHAHQAIMEVVKLGYDAYLATLGDSAPWCAIRPVGTPLDKEAIARASEALATIHVPTTKTTGEPHKNWIKNLDKAKESIDAGDWEGFVNIGLVKKMLVGAAKFGHGEIEEEHRLAFEPLIDHARYVLTLEHAKRTDASRRLLERFDRAYQRAKRALGGVTFSDPPRLLLEADTTGDLTHLYYRLDAQLRHVLLDEFQDTSMTQYRLLEPILDELVSQASDERSVFCVGDVKQSLYAWRQAEPTLLLALPKRWPTMILDTLSKSWRSSPAVLDAVNAIFDGMTSNAALQISQPARDAAAAWEDGFTNHVPAHTTLSGSARLIVAEEPDDDDDYKKHADHFALETCADRVAAAHEQAPNATIGVLVRKVADLRTILGMLKRRNIDATERHGNPLVDAPSVAAATSMLRLIEHPGNTARLRHVATTPLGKAVGLTNPFDGSAAHRVAAVMRQRIAECGCAALLSDWLSACVGSMDDRGKKRFEQFIDLADTWDAAGRSGPADLAAIAETRCIDEPGRAPVRVMTIHGSKGLEFDVVVVPLVGAKGWQVSSRSVIMGRDEPLGPVTRVSRYPNELMRALHPELADLHGKALQKQINEELCCLYVAATRAKRCLELVVPADEKGRDGEALDPDQWRLHPAHVVRAALVPDLPSAPGATLWSSSTEDDWTYDRALQRPHVAQAPVEIISLKTCLPKRRSTARLTVVSPSQIPDGKVESAASLLERRNRRALTHGELIHLWFEQIVWLDEGQPDDSALRSAATHRGFGDELIERAMPTFRNALACEPIRAALTETVWRSAAAAVQDVSVYCERLFAVRDTVGHADRLVQGRFDRLVVGRVDGEVVRAQVIDYKTDARAANLADEALDSYAERHRSQMEAYRRAAASLLNTSKESIATRLLFTAAGAAVTMPCAQ